MPPSCALRLNGAGNQLFASALSDTCVLRLRHLCFTAQTLVFCGSNTCVCHDKDLHLSDRGLAVDAGSSFPFLFNRCESAFKVLGSDMEQTPVFLHDGAVPGKNLLQLYANVA